MKYRLSLILMLGGLIYLPLYAGENRETTADREVLQWSQLPDLPNKVGVAGSFAGVHNDVLIVAGGANFPGKMPWDGGQKVWYDDIYALETTGDGQYQWHSDFKLDRPLAYGGSVTTDQGVVCIGGCDIYRWWSGNNERRSGDEKLLGAGSCSKYRDGQDRYQMGATAGLARTGASASCFSGPE